MNAPSSDRRVLIAVSNETLRHGRDCPKVVHVGGGYLHSEKDDRPYDVDGVAYCGRCHAWMGAAVAIPKLTQAELDYFWDPDGDGDL